MTYMCNGDERVMVPEVGCYSGEDFWGEAVDGRLVAIATAMARSSSVDYNLSMNV